MREQLAIPAGQDIKGRRGDSAEVSPRQEFYLARDGDVWVYSCRLSGVAEIASALSADM